MIIGSRGAVGGSNGCWDRALGSSHLGFGVDSGRWDSSPPGLARQGAACEVHIWVVTQPTPDVPPSAARGLWAFNTAS